MNILIVDDVQVNIDLLEVIATSMGHNCTFSYNGTEAVNTCIKERPDMVFMDVMMPIEDGLSATARIKESELGYWLPIIIVSAKDNNEDIVLGLNSGADDYITKPIHVEIVKAKIRAVERTHAFQQQELYERELRQSQLIELAKENHTHLELRRLMDEAAIIVDTDIQGNITFSNDKFCELSGYTQEELIGKNHRILHSGAHSRDFFKELWRTIARGNVWQGDICNRSKTGSLYWVRTTIVPFLDRISGKPTSYRAIRFDITDRKKLETKLAQEKDRAEMTLAAIGDAIFKVTPFGHITFMNKTAEKITGTLFENIEGQHLKDILNFQGETINQFLTRMNEEKTIIQIHTSQFTSNNGVEYQLEGNISPIMENGEPIGSVLALQDVTDKKRLSEEVEWQAWHDILTSLGNRALLRQRFPLAKSSADKFNTLMAICLLDVDEFKPINDNFGHESGDLVLVEIARRLTDVIRQDDTAVRIGGDEFVLILNGFKKEDELKLALERILTSMTTPFHISNGHMTDLSISMGVSIYPVDSVDLDTMLRHADQALYKAKQQGKNRFLFFDPTGEEAIHSRWQEIKVIEQAIINQEMVLFYQPKVNMRTGELFGVEALVRWQHPEQGLLSPIAFLPKIESTDIINRLGEWVIETALLQLQEWSNCGKNWTISINIAAYHFMQSDFSEKLQQTFSKYPTVLPQALEIEILETAALDDLQHASFIIKQCQNIGVTFALDDFGTGYSSLSYLKELPTDCLKIDQSFVRDMLENDDDMALVEGIISLSKVFNRRVIAEGVETAEHGVLLMRLGCDYAQGYGIAKPMQSDKLISWAKNYTPDKSWNIWSSTTWELSNIPLLVAQQDHINWIQEIFTALEGGVLNLSESELTNHYECRLGRWYYGHGKMHYSHLRSFEELESLHIKVHELAYKLVTLKSTNQNNEVQKLSKELLIIKNKIIETLNKLQQEVNISSN